MRLAALVLGALQRAKALLPDHIKGQTTGGPTKVERPTPPCTPHYPRIHIYMRLLHCLRCFLFTMSIAP